MACKADVLSLHIKGVEPKEIAKRLKCSVPYVHATLQRAFNPNRAIRESAAANARVKALRRGATLEQARAAARDAYRKVKQREARA